MLLGALALLVLDALVVFWLAGGSAPADAAPPRRGERRCCSPALAALLIALAGVRADQSAAPQRRPRRRAPAPNPAAEDFALKATTETRLAYVVTGDAEVDNISKLGPAGPDAVPRAAHRARSRRAGRARHRRATSSSFFPLIYWPVVPSAPKPSPAALARIDAYMKQGGTVLFDTRDAIDGAARPRRRNARARHAGAARHPASLDIPELEPVPRDHVLTKTFFLLRDFPGRFNSRPALGRGAAAPPSDDETRAPGARRRRRVLDHHHLERSRRRLGDAPDGQPMLPLVPGEPRQREFAFRAGVNIVMYTLTGNYKADQVHVPALLERLGQ